MEQTREKILWLAVLERAVHDLIGKISYADGKYQLQIQDDARRWFKGTKKGIGTFLWICEQLDIDSQYYQSRVLSYAEEV